MAAKKTTKKSAKKATKKTSNTKKVSKKVGTEKVEPKKAAKAEETVTIKTSYIYYAIIAVGIVALAILLSRMDFGGGSSAIEGIVVVNDEDCINCRTDQIKLALQNLFPEATITEYDVSDAEAKKLVDLGVDALPAYFFSNELKGSSGYNEITSQFSEAFIETESVMYLHPGIISPGKILFDVNTEGAHVLGDEDAPVTIIEFSDFECPFCKRFFDETYSDLKAQFIDTGKAKLVFKHFPLPNHPQAEPAAQAAECAGEQGKFWEMHDLIFANQGSLSVENYKSWAANLGLDVEQFNNCLDSGKYAQKVSDDLQEGVNSYIGGTPSFIIDGQIIVGAQPVSAFAQLIE